MNPSVKKWSLFVLRWGVAVAGITYVLAKISWRDHALVILDDASKRPVNVVLLSPLDENSPAYKVVDPASGQVREVPRSQVVNEPDPRTAVLRQGGAKVNVLGLDLGGDINDKPWIERLLVADDATGPARWINATEAEYRLRVPRPRAIVGLLTLYHRADPQLLLMALAVFPFVLFLTSYRWHELLRAMEIRIPLLRTFVLNMVGAFYNSFMPGVTGGDVLKAYYASKQTTHRTRAVMSVFIDRIIGLLALVFVGGSAALFEAVRVGDARDPVARLCWRIAGASGLILAGTAAGLLVYFTPFLRRITGLDFILARLPAQKQIKIAMQVMDMYRRRPVLVLGAFLMSFPVHLLCAASAMFAGWAFELPISAGYYYVAVPVIILAGSIPISPQGAGVMEFFAIKLTDKQGATVSQAFALTMAIRIVQIFWNLVGGIFVLRGGFHAPTEAEAAQLSSDASATETPADTKV